MFSIIDMPSQAGKIAIVTGANIGLGFETTKGLAAKGALVIMACRNMQKAETAKEAILADTPGSQLETMELDLASKSSIEQFVEGFTDKYDQLDLLINNAGIMMPPYRETEEGFESQWGVNFLGHFLLTSLLLPLIEKSADSRIVILSSLAHVNGEIYFKDPNQKDSYKPMASYRQSKLACLIFALELQRRLEAKGSNTISIPAHPGVAITNLMHSAPKWMSILAPLFSWMLHSVEEGAKPTLMAAMDPGLKGGEYIGPTGKREMKGEPGIVDHNEISKDLEVADRLWKLAEESMGIEFRV